MRTIRINNDFRLEDYYTDENSGVTGPKGAFTFIDRGELADKAKKVYGRTDGVLKVFYSKPLKGIDRFSGEYVETPLDEFVWAKPGEVTVIEATRFQNVCHLQNHAPRIYGLVEVKFDDCSLLAQLTDDAGLMYVMEAEPEDVMQRAWDTIVAIANEWGYEVCFKEINDGAFWGGGKRSDGPMWWLDFQDFMPKKNGEYEEKICKLLLKECQHFSVPVYQIIPQLTEHFAKLGVTGWRDCHQRFKDFGLDKFPWEGKTYLDIGCDNGMMLYEADKAGALRTVGCDGKEDVEDYRLSSLKHVQNYIGNWNADLYGMNLKAATTQKMRDKFGFEQFDVVSFLAMGNHVGHFPEYLAEMTRELLIYEKNDINNVTMDQVRDELIKMGFPRIEYGGRTGDPANREFILAWK